MKWCLLMVNYPKIELEENKIILLLKADLL